MMKRNISLKMRVVVMTENYCTIVCHTNEPTEIKFYLKSNNIPIQESSTLPFDYLVVYDKKRIGVERKEASDFVASIMDGRLWEQLYAMSTLCPLNFLVVIGNITSVLIERKFPRSAYIGALVSSAIKTSPDGLSGYVSVVSLDTIYDFMEFLRLLCRKVTEDDVRLPIKPINKTDLKSLQIQTLATLPGVGEVYAKELLDEFGSIYAVANASITQLEKVLGRKRAEKVYKFLRGELKTL